MSIPLNASDGFALTAVVPCFNEADNVGPAYDEILRELAGYDLEVLFVDDGSTDETLAQLRRLAATDPPVRYISFSRNFGFEAAFSAGYRYANQPWVLHLDADLQFPPSQAHALVAAAQQGYDAVFGTRITRDDPAWRRWCATAYHLLARRLLRIELPTRATTFRLVRAELARRVVDLRLGTPYFLATVPRLTNRYTTVQVEHRARRRGRSKFRFSRLVAHAFELYFGFSRRMATGAAGLALLAAGMAGLTVLAALAGWLSALQAVVVSLAAQMVALIGTAVLVRYLVLIADAQTRPALFYIREASIPVDPADLLYPTTPVKTLIAEGQQLCAAS